MEIGAGTGLVLGLLTAPCAAALLATMVVAGRTAHRRNGFFAFEDSYEHVLVVGASSPWLSQRSDPGARASTPLSASSTTTTRHTGASWA